jgi:hypothetical protein
MHAANTLPTTQPRQANAPVRALAPRDGAAATMLAPRPTVRVLQANRAPAQLTLLLRPPSARR